MRILIFFSLLIFSLAYFSYQIYRRICYIRLGKQDDYSDQPVTRIKYLCQAIFQQRKIAEYPLSGTLHFFIMWGLIILMFSSLDMAALVLFNVKISWLEYPFFLFLRDLFILLLVIGIIGFTVRRLVLKFLKQNWLHSSSKTYTILILIFIIDCSLLTYFAAYTALMEPLPGAWLVNPLAYGLASLGKSATEMLMEISWWSHFLAISTFLLVIPNSNYLHLVFAPFSIYLRSLRQKGALMPVALADTNKQTCGVKLVNDFTRKQLLDTFSCLLCGRCHRECPSERSNERLKPKRLNGFIRAYLEDEGHKLLAGQPSIKMAGDLFYYDFIWSCTTCGSCNEACPVSVDHISKIIDLRRGIISEQERIPAAMREFFNNVEHAGNPFGRLRQSDQDYAWAGDLRIPILSKKPHAEYLFYIGCQGTFNASTAKVAAALAKIMQLAGVDYAILGDEEWCCGETARRMGNELLFQNTVRKNIALWQEYGVNKIITFCPHCYNTLKNEYPQFGGNYEVIPHPVLLAEMLEQGRLPIASSHDIVVTYHDACYLGRYNDIFEQPRQVLRSIPGVRLTEMPRSQKKSFCCGAGGGRFWTRSSKENPISMNRVKEALATEATTVITSCPYCRNIFEGDMLVQDIAELLLTTFSTNDILPV
ncbi:succinate dehydrogenase/fumarate reductase iron-sulfur subunit [Sporotomaculum syntrophicum]|uniref:Succinate dehydrogenase/fumarate reductase iron-sulfur subunit n=2 Tax=Sporotomaculum syntrophicum TaxID=182264 RepID=A0A9D2WM65_9FIRM|nr:succinate dehydrogenase/fumarate reductase iron-sulfur subunit [Sporotomaculum syntrophicum]